MKKLFFAVLGLGAAVVIGASRDTIGVIRDLDRAHWHMNSADRDAASDITASASKDVASGIKRKAAVCGTAAVGTEIAGHKTAASAEVAGACIGGLYGTDHEFVSAWVPGEHAPPTKPWWHFW
jgi:hypothetical protein